MTRQRAEKLRLPKARLALVVDQFEELFTSGFSAEVRQKYISALGGLVRSRRVFVLAALRSDFYPSYQEFPDLVELAKPRGKFDRIAVKVDFTWVVNSSGKTKSGKSRLHLVWQGRTNDDLRLCPGRRQRHRESLESDKRLL